MSNQFFVLSAASNAESEIKKLLTGSLRTQQVRRVIKKIAGLGNGASTIHHREAGWNILSLQAAPDGNEVGFYSVENADFDTACLSRMHLNLRQLPRQASLVSR